MRFERKDFRWILSISFLYTLIIPPLFPHFMSHPFAPVVVVALFFSTIDRLLAIALFMGVINDLIICELPFGLTPLLYMGSAWLLFRYKHLIRQDTFISLPLFTAFFSLLLNLGELFFLRGGFVVLIQREFFMQPFQDGLATLVIYSLPTFFLNQRRRRAKPSLFSYKER